MLGLANYFARPRCCVRPVHEIAEDFRYDIERLSAFYAISYETICHRPVDAAGARSSGACRGRSSESTAPATCRSVSPHGFPLLVQRRHVPAVEPCTRRSRTPQDHDADRADAVRPQLPVGGAHRRAPRAAVRAARKTFRDRLGCELRHAPRVVYGDGLDLVAAPPHPIGAGCRVCERMNAPSGPSLPWARNSTCNEHRSSVSPYTIL